MLNVVFLVSESYDEKDIVNILESFVKKLETLREKTWPNLLPGIYMKSYSLMKKYHPLDFKMCSTESEERQVAAECGTVLLYGELCVDHAAVTRNKKKEVRLADSYPRSKILNGGIKKNIIFSLRNSTVLFFRLGTAFLCTFFKIKFNMFFYNRGNP